MRIAAVVLLFPLSLLAAEWTRFRGPNGAGVAQARDLPGEFAPGKNMTWRIEMLPGFSSPVVSGNSVFVTGHEGGKLFTIAIDRASGVVRWKIEAPKHHAGKPPGPNSPVSSSPVTDGRNVYAFFDTFGLVSYTADGKERWRYAMGPFTFPYGAGSSPVISGDMLLLACDQDAGSFLLALDKDSGKVRWKTERPHATHSFSSPVVHRPAKGPAEVIVSGAYELNAYELATGKKLWWVTGMAWQAKSVPVIAADVAYVHSWMASLAELGHKEVTWSWKEALEKFDSDKDSRIAKQEYPDESLVKIWFLYDLDKDGYLGETDWKYLLARSNTKNGLYAVKLGGRGDVTATHVLWRYDKGLPNIPSPLYYGDVLYLLREGGILTAFRPADGKVLKQGRIEGAIDAYFASPVAADGKIIAASQPGKVAVVQPGAEWQTLSVGDFGEEIWATPAIDGRQVFIRTQKALYCFEKKPA